MPVDAAAPAAERAGSIAWQMQRLFYELQTAARAPDTRGLSRLLGGTEEEGEEQASPQQQDVHELRTKKVACTMPWSQKRFCCSL
jgi:hypothetical protein